jgi:copper chaperone CopZ
VSVALENLAGVDAVKVSLQKATADIQLDEGNKITLAQIRRVIRTSGYPTRDAQIDAKGRIVIAGGKPSLDLLNGSTLPIVAGAKRATDGVVQVTGVSRSGSSKEGEQFTVTSIK